MDLEARNNFLLIKANKLTNEPKEQKLEAEVSLNKLNESLVVISKIEEYIGNPGNVVNKAKLFDNYLAANPVSCTKGISILVDFASKMEELLNDMRGLFDGLAPEPIQEAALE